MTSPARVVALATLGAVHRGADLPDAIARSRARLADERDRALVAAVVTGVLRWRAALDHAIAGLVSRPLERLDPEVLDALRLGVFQLQHLTRVPPRAVLNDTVESVRRAGKSSATGLVNAVLRRVASGQAPPLPPRPGGPVTARDDAALDYLSVSLSHPRWLSARWLERHGFEAAERWATFDNEPAPLTLRVNTLATTTDDLAAELAAMNVSTRRARYAPDALVVESGQPLGLPPAAGGRFVVQDEASQLVAHFCAVRPGERVLDACAAPGGKTTALAAAMSDRGTIVASDLRPRRVGLLRDAVRAAGARSVAIVRADASRHLPFARVFDCVLIDAPCSGLGTLRRDPEIRWRRQETDLLEYGARQRRMLDRAAEVVRPGGRLVYATCSSEPDENEDVVEAFLSARADFERRPKTVHPWVATPHEALLTDRGDLQTLPHRHGLEAFFAAMLVRADGW